MIDASLHEARESRARVLGATAETNVNDHLLKNFDHSHLLEIHLELVYAVLFDSSCQPPAKTRNELRFRLVEGFPYSTRTN